MSDWSTAIETAAGVARIIASVIKLIDEAINGNDDAIDKLKRVEQILSPTSPTERAFERASDLAAGKPPRDDEPTRETDPE